MDVTGLQTLEEAIERMQKRGVTILLCEANERVYAKLVKSGIMAMIGAHNYFKLFSAALSHSSAKIGAVTSKLGQPSNRLGDAKDATLN